MNRISKEMLAIVALLGLFGAGDALAFDHLEITVVNPHVVAGRPAVTVETDFSGSSIFIVADEVGDTMPWLILLAALGSQTSAIIGATMSRSDMLVTHKVVQRNVSRRATFLILLVPAIALFLLADITMAVALASRVFAVYFVLQAAIAWILARRKGNWAAVAGFTGIGAMMATIAIFGLPL